MTMHMRERQRGYSLFYSLQAPTNSLQYLMLAWRQTAAVISQNNITNPMGFLWIPLVLNAQSMAKDHLRAVLL